MAHSLVIGITYSKPEASIGRKRSPFGHILVVEVETAARPPGKLAEEVGF